MPVSDVIYAIYPTLVVCLSHHLSELLISPYTIRHFGLQAECFFGPLCVIDSVTPR